MNQMFSLYSVVIEISIMTEWIFVIFLLWATEGNKCLCMGQATQCQKALKLWISRLWERLALECWVLDLSDYGVKLPQFLMSVTPIFFPVLLKTPHQSACIVLLSVYIECSPISILKMCQFPGVWNGKLQYVIKIWWMI